MVAQDLVTRLLDSADPDDFNPQRYLDALPSKWAVVYVSPRGTVNQYLTPDGRWSIGGRDAELFQSKEEAELRLDFWIPDEAQRSGVQAQEVTRLLGLGETVNTGVNEAADPDDPDAAYQRYLDDMVKRYPVGTFVTSKRLDAGADKTGADGLGETVSTGVNEAADPDDPDAACQRYLDDMVKHYPVGTFVTSKRLDARYGADKMFGEIKSMTSLGHPGHKFFNNLPAYYVEWNEHPSFNGSYSHDDLVPNPPHQQCGWTGADDWTGVDEEHPSFNGSYPHDDVDEAVNPEACRNCGGRCCKQYPGITSPEDWGAPDTDQMLQRLSAAFKEDTYEVDHWYGDPREGAEQLDQVSMVRPTARRGLVALTEPCQMLGAQGCSLPYEQRPKQCRELSPITVAGKHSCVDNYSKKQAAIDWIPYQDVVKAAFRTMWQESADPDDPESMLSRMRVRWAVVSTGHDGQKRYLKVITLTDRQRAAREQAGKPDCRWFYDWVLDIKRASLYTGRDAAAAVLHRYPYYGSRIHNSVEEVSHLLKESTVSIGEAAERVVAAAIRVSGKIFTGMVHADAQEKAVEDPEVGGTAEMGFVTSLGRFIDREEALRIGQRQQQMVNRSPLNKSSGASAAQFDFAQSPALGEAVDPDDIDFQKYIDAVHPELEVLMRYRGYESNNGGRPRYYKDWAIDGGRFLTCIVTDAPTPPHFSRYYWVQARIHYPNDLGLPYTEIAYHHCTDDTLNPALDFVEKAGSHKAAHDMTDAALQKMFARGGWEYHVVLGESLSDDPDDIDLGKYIDALPEFRRAPSGILQGRWTSWGNPAVNPAVIYATKGWNRWVLHAYSGVGRGGSATADQVKAGFASVLGQIAAQKLVFTLFDVDRDVEAVYGLEADGVIKVERQSGAAVYAHMVGVDKGGRLGESLLDDFVRLNLKDAPRFQVAQNVSCNDVDRIGGPPEFLPVAVVSYDTMQKYIVPRGDGYLVPVPVGDNWSIHKLSEAQLKQVIMALSANAGATLADFYALAQQTGAFWRNYYESAEPVMEMGGAVNIWLSPAGKSYLCHDHADWAATEVLKKPLSEMSGANWERRGFVYRQMFRRGWARLAMPHAQKKLMVDAPRATAAQWEWIYDKGWEERLQVVDDQEQTIIDYREGSGMQPPKGPEMGTWESLQVADPDDPEAFIRRMPVPYYIVRGRASPRLDWVYVRQGAFLSLDSRTASQYPLVAAQGIVDRFSRNVPGEYEIVPVQESVDPDAPERHIERYIQSIGHDFGAWLVIHGLKKVSDSVVDEYQTEGFLEGASHKLRVIHFKDGVDYRSNPRGPWMWLLMGTNRHDEGEEAAIRPAVERFLQRFKSTDDDVPAVEEAMVEVLLNEADPDDFDAEMYLHRTTDIREMKRALRMYGGKAWPQDPMERCFKHYMFNQPVLHDAVKFTGVVVYDFGGRPARRLELAAGLLTADGRCSPQVSMDMDDDDNRTVALARMIHHLDKFFASYDTTGKDWKTVQREVNDELLTARRQQHVSVRSKRKLGEAADPDDPERYVDEEEVLQVLRRYGFVQNTTNSSHTWPGVWCLLRNGNRFNVNVRRDGLHYWVDTPWYNSPDEVVTLDVLKRKLAAQTRWLGEAADPDEPTEEMVIRLGKPGDCHELCEVCGKYCTLNHFQTRNGIMMPNYHICIHCDMKSMKGEE